MATEVEVIKFQGDIDDLKKSLKILEDKFSDLENKGKKSAKSTESAFSKLGANIKNSISNLPFGFLIDDLDKAGENAGLLSKGISEIGSGANKASGGVKALTSLIGVGLLGALTLVVAGIASLYSFIKQTDEGATQLEATFAGVGAATDVLTGKLAQAGSSIVNFFSDGSQEGSTFSKVLDGLTIAFYAAVPGSTQFASALSDTNVQMKEAYNRAYDLAIELDAIQDAMRLLSVESKQAELQIQALLKQAKNRGIDVTTRLDLIAQAQEIENSNLQKNFELQKQYYANIAETNVLKLESINQDKKSQVENVKSFVLAIKTAKNAEELLYYYQEQVKAQEGLLSISDDLAQNQVNGLEKIIELDGRSQVLTEKYAAIKSQLIEKEIADRTEAIKAVERAREADAINTIKDEQKLSAEILAIKIRSLQAQRALQLQYGKDVSAIDLEIATLNKKYLDDLAKAQADADAKRLASEKARSDAERKLSEDNYNKSIQDIDENSKFRLLSLRENIKDEEKLRQEELKLSIGALEAKKVINEESGKSTLDIELEIQAKKKELYAQDVKDYEAAQAKKKQSTLTAIDYISSNTESIYNGLAQNQQARTQTEISDSQRLSQQKILFLQQQLDAGVISQQKYDAEIRASQAKQIAYENNLKTKQAQADKRSQLFNIVINTATAISKTLANLGIPAGIPAALLAAAQGAAQYAIVNARPIPKYKDGVIDVQGKGTGTSDSIDAKISKGESVMTAKETDENLGLLWAIRKNRLDEYINRAWVLPALNKRDEQKQSKEQRYNKMMKRAVNSNKNNDTFELERAIRRNKSVRIENWGDMPIGKGRNIV